MLQVTNKKLKTHKRLLQRSANSRGRCPGQISADGQLFCNARDYDVLVAHTTIVFLRYMFWRISIVWKLMTRHLENCSMPAVMRFPIFHLLNRFTG